MRAVPALAIAVALCAAPPAIAKPKPRSPSSAATPVAAPDVTVVRFADGWRADLALDGPLLGWALPRMHDGHRELLLLAGPRHESSPPEEGAPCGVRDRSSANARNARLWRWRSESRDRLELLGSGLPAGSLESADLDADGEDELLLQHDGGIDLVTLSSDGSAGTRALVEDSELGPPCCGPRIAWDGTAARDATLRVAVLGAFRTYRLGQGGTTTVVSELAIPALLKAGAERVLVESPTVRSIGRTAAGRMLFATEPEALGRRRLRTFLLDPDGPADTRVVESWALFPEPERVVDSAFAMLDGSPVLIVTTTSADKLSLLGEKALRMYPLGGDRTRAGNAPIFAATTGINLWQQAHPAVVDLDRDGRDDLVLAHWKGLKNSIAALEVYRGGAASGFAKPRSMSFDVENGERAFLEFGADADGDGRPDLILLANRELLVFPGAPSERAAQRAVETRPSRRIPLMQELPRAQGFSVSMGPGGFQISRSAGGFGTPHLIDLDGDGRPEAVFAGGGGNAGRASVVFLRGGSALAPGSSISYK